MRTLLLVAMSIMMSLIIVHCVYGDWVKSQSSENGTVTETPSSMSGYTYSSRDGSATASGNPTDSMMLVAEADARGYRDGEATVAMQAVVTGYKLIARMDWDDECEGPEVEQFLAEMTRTFEWLSEGNAGNWWPTTGYAMADSDGQINVNTMPDNDGDANGVHEANGSKTEGASGWSAALTVEWPWTVGVTVGWDDSASSDDYWKDEDDETDNYAENFSNREDDTTYTYAIVEVSLKADAEGNTGNYGIRGRAELTTEVLSLDIELVS